MLAIDELDWKPRNQSNIWEEVVVKSKNDVPIFIERRIAHDDMFYFIYGWAGFTSLYRIPDGAYVADRVELLMAQCLLCNLLNDDVTGLTLYKDT